MLIKAQHKRWARVLYDLYIRRLLRKSFSAFYVLNDIPQRIGERSLVITPNHFSWWDGFFADHLMKNYTDKKIHLLMLEDQLKRYWFFSKVGAYSINPKSGRSIAETSQYTRHILTDKRNYCVIYPQGEIEEYDKRPVTIKRGLTEFIKNVSPAPVIIPVAFKIVYSNVPLPYIKAIFGEVLDGESVINDFSLFTSAFNSNLAILDETEITGKEKNIL